MWQRTYQQPVRGTCQSAIVMDSAVQNGGFCRDSLLRVVIHNVPGFHVKRPSGAKKKKHKKNKAYEISDGGDGEAPGASELVGPL